MTLAVYLLGGETKPIDTEHVSVKAAEMAPGRYNWRFYPQHINIEIIRAFLSDAKKQKYGNYLSGSGNEGWMLTEAGAIFAKMNVSRLESANLGGVRMSDGEKKWFRRERSRLLSSDAFLKFRSGKLAEITQREAASLFRLDEYVTGVVRARKIDRIVNAFRDDSELGAAVIQLRDLVAKAGANEH
ncbi:MAG: hypothetical protein WCJ41_20070 [Aestuariivirga sp.]|uniref:hypothetical protein n=1 Tax=Aestuariivirga sp. TaxID=2650926 RepID=UPI00301846C3